MVETDGKIWLPGGGQREDDDCWPNGYFVSYDNGQTWPEWHTVCIGLQDEKDMLELTDGRLLAVIRSGQEAYRCISTDRGETWSEPEKLPIYGQCPSLLLLPSGNVLFAYREVAPGKPKGVGLALSDYRGLSWKILPPLYVSPDDSRDCAYPSMVLSGTDKVLCAYYSAFLGGDCHIELATLVPE